LTRACRCRRLLNWMNSGSSDAISQLVKVGCCRQILHEEQRVRYASSLSVDSGAKLFLGARGHLAPCHRGTQRRQGWAEPLDLACWMACSRDTAALVLAASARNGRARGPPSRRGCVDVGPRPVAAGSRTRRALTHMICSGTVGRGVPYLSGRACVRRGHDVVGSAASRAPASSTRTAGGSRSCRGRRTMRGDRSGRRGLRPRPHRARASCGWWSPRDDRDVYSWKVRAQIGVAGRLARLARVLGLDDQS
jgi:hypothetical protein